MKVTIDLENLEKMVEDMKCLQKKRRGTFSN